MRLRDATAWKSIQNSCNHKKSKTTFRISLWIVSKILAWTPNGFIFGFIPPFFCFLFFHNISQNSSCIFFLGFIKGFLLEISPKIASNSLLFLIYSQSSFWDFSGVSSGVVSGISPIVHARISTGVPPRIYLMIFPIRFQNFSLDSFRRFFPNYSRIYPSGLSECLLTDFPGIWANLQKSFKEFLPWDFPGFVLDFSSGFILEGFRIPL